MKREVMLALLGASMFLPVAADGQRGRDRVRARDGHASTTIVASGRLAGCVAPAGARPFDCRARVVYSYGGRRGYAPRGSQVWIRADWGPVRVGVVRYHPRDRFLNQGELKRLIGSRTVDRLRDEGRRSGLRGSLRGEWVNAGIDGLILVVTMEDVDVAELVDFDRDGVIDEIFLIRSRIDRHPGGRW